MTNTDRVVSDGPDAVLLQPTPTGTKPRVRQMAVKRQRQSPRRKLSWTAQRVRELRLNCFRSVAFLFLAARSVTVSSNAVQFDDG